MPIDPVLVQLLGSVAQRFPAVFGCAVAPFLWGADDVVSLWATTGWRAVLGHLDTEDATRGAPGPDPALAALKGQLNFVKPTFGYIDRRGGRRSGHRRPPGLPAEVTAALPPVAPRSSRRRGVLGAPPTAPPTPGPTPTSSPSASAAPTSGITLITPPATTPTTLARRIGGLLANAIPGPRGAQRGEDRPGRG